ncbi:hypothetical protein P7D73_18175 [Enterococcus raffinosus]|uniref:pLS20_p028 family conjugation system transmembrane protein n=1 Tax=Enterococcus raffinosus TaxID=71452 RepID=UPI00288D91F0|nr:hypothetical protein [Enterococcus raffinosus]MDT2525134.1 hypothetical protein [Enterococcus raffinosus]MDT2592489.1 hypothetical protein [Enterococcus raffinosus]
MFHFSPYFLVGAITSDKQLAEVYDKYKDVFHKTTAIGSILQDLSGGVMKFLFSVTQIVEEVYKKTFELAGFTTNSQLNGLQLWFRGVGLAICVLSLVYLGISYIAGKDLKWTHIVKQICVSTMGIFLVPYILGFVPNLINSSYNEIGHAVTGGSNIKNDSISFAPIKNNIVDLYSLDHDSFKTDVEKVKQKNKITPSNIGLVDFGELVDKDSAKKMDNPKVFQNYLHLDFNKDKDSYSNKVEKLDSHVFLKNLNSYYLRYSGSKIIVDLQLIIITAILLMCAIKFVKLVFQLAIYGIINPFIALSDIRDGKRYKQLINTIIGTVISMVMTLAVVYVFTILLTVINNFNLAGLNWFGRGLFNIIGYLGAFFAAFAGVGFIERITGVENGMSNELANSFAMYEGSKMLASAGGMLFHGGSNLASSVSKQLSGGDGANGGGNGGSGLAGATANNSKDGTNTSAYDSQNSSNDNENSYNNSAYDSNQSNQNDGTNSSDQKGGDANNSNSQNSENANSNSADQSNSNDNANSENNSDEQNNVSDMNQQNFSDGENHDEYNADNVGEDSNGAPEENDLSSYENGEDLGNNSENITDDTTGEDGKYEGTSSDNESGDTNNDPDYSDYNSSNDQSEQGSLGDKEAYNTMNSDQNTDGANNYSQNYDDKFDANNSYSQNMNENNPQNSNYANVNNENHLEDNSKLDAPNYSNEFNNQSEQDNNIPNTPSASDYYQSGSSNINSGDGSSNKGFSGSSQMLNQYMRQGGSNLYKGVEEESEDSEI